MAITVSDKPKIITKGRKVRISKSDLVDIVNFVIRNQDFLKEIADYRAIDDKLDKKLQTINEDVRMGISYDALFYGYNVQPDVTGLPFKIFISPKPNHDIGVKFPPNRNFINASTRDFAEMQVSDYRVRCTNAKVDNYFVIKVMNYIKLNQKTFEAMRDKEKIIQLIAKLIKVDKDGNPITVEHKVFRCDKEYFGFTRVRNSEGDFNFVNRKNELLSEIWFDSADNFEQLSKKIGAIVTINHVKYIIDKDGLLKKI
jgi:hypothetical protein